MTRQGRYAEEGHGDLQHLKLTGFLESYTHLEMLFSDEACQTPMLLPCIVTCACETVVLSHCGKNNMSYIAHGVFFLGELWMFLFSHLPNLALVTYLAGRGLDLERMGRGGLPPLPLNSKEGTGLPDKGRAAVFLF